MLRDMRRAQSQGIGPGSGNVSPKRGAPGSDASTKNKTSVVIGLLIYLGLVTAAFFLGTLLPSKPVKVQPVPHNKRTFCTRPPEPFDPSAAKGKKVLITGAAGFIGSHLARCVCPRHPASVPLHVLRDCSRPTHAAIPDAAACSSHLFYVKPHWMLGRISTVP